MSKECERIEVYETAICFARMWGVMETLEPIPNISFEKLRDILMSWAAEFSADRQKDHVKFFIQKAGDIKKQPIV